MVASAPLHFLARDAIRNTWGRFSKQQLDGSKSGISFRAVGRQDSNSQSKQSRSTSRDRTNYGGVPAAADSSKIAHVSNRSSTVVNNHDANSNNTSEDSSISGYSVVFFVGAVEGEDKESESIRTRLQGESARHGDLVVSSFTDSYQNLTLKTIAMLQWANQSCASPDTFLIKCDDDAYLNVPLLLRAVQEKLATPFGNSHFVLGHVFKDFYVNREKGDKYYVSREEVPDDKYPPAVSGSAYGMRVATASLLYQVGTIRPNP